MTDFQRIMGIDHGERRIGVALSDPLGMFASPHSIVENVATETVMAALQALIKQETVGKVVVGLPTATDGGIGKQAAVVIRWARELAASVQTPILLWDESYSSERAVEIVPKRKRRGEPIDDVAAASILQEYLDARESSDYEPGQPLETYSDIE